MVGWVHIKFKKPLIVNGFSLTNGDNSDLFYKDFRFYGKVINKKEDLIPQDEKSFGHIAGFTLLKTVK